MLLVTHKKSRTKILEEYCPVVVVIYSLTISNLRARADNSKFTLHKLSAVISRPIFSTFAKVTKLSVLIISYSSSIFFPSISVITFNNSLTLLTLFQVENPPFFLFIYFCFVFSFDPFTCLHIRAWWKKVFNTPQNKRICWLAPHHFPTEKSTEADCIIFFPDDTV